MRGCKTKKNIAQVILNHRQIKKKQEMPELSHAVVCDWKRKDICK